MLDVINELALTMHDDDRAIVVAPAAVLTDAHLRQAAQFQQDHDAQPQWCMAPGVADVGVPVGQATHGPDHVHPYAHGHPHDHHHPHPH